MTPNERAAIEAKTAARNAVLAKWSDGSQMISDEDCRHLTGPEISHPDQRGQGRGNRRR